MTPHIRIQRVSALFHLLGGNDGPYWYCSGMPASSARRRMHASLPCTDGGCYCVVKVKGPAVMDDDPYSWLEAIDGEEALDWVARHNASTLARLSGERFEQMRADALDVLDADTRIPPVERCGEYLYNFWRDGSRPRGVWRRTTLEEYRKDAPAWDIVIDVDALAAAEDENWVWGGADIIEPGYTRAFVDLSRGGADASVVREFDMITRQFVADGFNLAEAKSAIAWEDEDTALVGTDFGEGSLTDSGYPRLVKRWRRGTPLEDAETIFSGSTSDVSVVAYRIRYPGFERTLIHRAVDFYNKETYELRDGELIRLDIPTDCSIALHREWMMIALRSDWRTDDTTYTAGSVLIADYEQIVAGTAELRVVFEAGGDEFFAAGAFTGGRFISIKLRDVATVVEVVTPGTWKFEPLPGVPDNTTTVLAGFDVFGDEIFLHTTGFDKPPRLLHGASAGPIREIKSSPAFFDADDLVVTQHFTASSDGTQVPYFLVAHRGSTSSGPTLLAGYGAFLVAQLPAYLGVTGRLWLARGEHPRRRGIRTSLARPGCTRGQAQGRRGFRSGGQGSGRLRHHDHATAWRDRRQRRRPADGHYVDPLPPAVRGAGLLPTAVGHAPLPPPAGWRLLDR
jgi:prolyl oligopeptidase